MSNQEEKALPDDDIRKRIKKVLLALTFLASTIFFVGAFGALLFGSSVRSVYVVPLTLYFLATALTAAAVFHPSVPQWLRYPGVLANVAGVAFPISVWARWLTGNLDATGIEGLVPCVGFSLLSAAMLWLLEAPRIFRPSLQLSVAVAILTFLTIAVSLIEPASAPAAQDYATQFLKLEYVTRFVGVAYVLTLAVWVALLHTGTINEVD